MWKYKKEVKSRNSLIYFFYLDEYLGQLTMCFYAIIDISIIVYANIFSPGTKKKCWGIPLSSTNLSMTMGYANILENIGKEYFVYINKNV